MSFLLRRSSRSGTAPPWFYVAMAIGFAGLAAWGVVQGDWVVAGIAVAMVVVVAAGAAVMRRLRMPATTDHPAVAGSSASPPTDSRQPTTDD